jgi:hypothetical protein
MDMHMKSLNARGLVAALVLVAAVGAANAQENPWVVRVGVANLTDSNARASVGTNSFSLGAGYTFGAAEFWQGATQSVEFDWSTASRDGNRLNVYGAQYMLRFPFGVGQQGFAPYGGVGVGFFVNEWRPSTNVGGGAGIAFVGAGETSTRLGGSLLLGAAIGNQFLVEIAYRLSGSVAGARTDAWVASLGVRF